MEGRRVSRWRSIPPELGVPIVAGAVIAMVQPWLGYPSPGIALLRTASLSLPILVLAGLLDLRRRSTEATATILGIAAGLQGVAVAQVVVASFLFPNLSLELLRHWSVVLEGISFVLPVVFAVVLTTAARAWLTVGGPIVVVTAVLGRSPYFLARLLIEWTHDRQGVPAGFTLLVLVQAVGWLAIYGRLGAAAPPRRDLMRAARGARRAATWLWLRLGAAVISVLVVLVAGGAIQFADSSGREVVLNVALVAALAVTAGVVSGLLGLARACVVGLSPVALCVAVFGAAWAACVGYEQARLATFNLGWSAGPSWDAVAPVLASAACIGVGAWAIRRYARRARDPWLGQVVSWRIAWFLAIHVASLVAIELCSRDTLTGIWIGLFALAAQLAAPLVLAGAFARLADRLALTSEIEVF